MDIIEKRKDGSVRQAVRFIKGNGKTQQQFKKDCDINHIVAKYVKTGVIDSNIINQRALVFDDVSDIGDFGSVVQRIKSIETEFMKLKPEVRSKFNNDPGLMLNFIGDPKNLEESIKLGILDKSLMSKVVKDKEAVAKATESAGKSAEDNKPA